MLSQPGQHRLRLQLPLQLLQKQRRQLCSRARPRPPRRSPCTESLGLHPPLHLQVSRRFLYS